MTHASMTPAEKPPILQSPKDKNSRFLGFDIPFLISEWKSMFNFATIPADIWAGITVALVALPLNLALAIAAGVEPGVGITTGIVAGLIGSLFGGQRYAVTGPAAAMAVVLIGIAQKYGIDGIWLVGLIAGIMQILSGAFKFGKLISFIPMPVIVGFANAIGILVIFNSLDDFLGFPTKPIAHAGQVAPFAGHPLVPEFIQDISHIFWRLIVHQEANIYAIAIGSLVLVLAVMVPKWVKLVPGQLVAIVVASLVASQLDFHIPRIIDISQIPAGIPLPQIPHLPFEEIDVLFGAAITVFMLGSIESLLSASVADGMTMSNRHHSDQELIGQGLANVVAPFFGGIPVTGVIARTAVNIRSGAKTRLSGIIHAFVLLLLSLLLSKYAEQIPLAALGGILILTGFRLIEWEAFKQIWYASKYEGYVVIITTAASVLVDLTAGVMIGLVMACGLFIRQMSVVKITQQDNNGHSLGTNPQFKQTTPSCKFVGTFLVDGPLFFGAAERFTETILLTQHLKVVVLHMRAVSHMDLTGAETVLSIHAQLKRNNVRLVLAELPSQPFSLLKRLNAMDKIGHENFYSSYREAILSVNQSLLETTCKSCASCLDPNFVGKRQGPKDCNLRNALVLNTNQMSNIMRARLQESACITPVLAAPSDNDENKYRLISIVKEEDIPDCLLGTPIEALIRSQNLYEVNEPDSDKADLIIAMCMDYRKQLHLPKNCAYIIRRAGANMKGSEFSIAMAVSAGINHMALIVHNKCIMSAPFERKEQFVHTLVAEQGWPSFKAEAFFDDGASRGEISDAIEFGLQESHRIMSLFPRLNVVPLLYNVDDDKIYLLKDWLFEQEPDEPVLSQG